MKLLDILRNLVNKYGVNDLMNPSAFLSYLKSEATSDDLHIQILILYFMYTSYGNLFKTFYNHRFDEVYLDKEIYKLIKMLEKDEISSQTYAYPLYCVLVAAGVVVDKVEYKDPRKYRYSNLNHTDAGYGVRDKFANDYEINEGVLVKYRGKTPLVIIPNEVKEIGPECFSYNSDVKIVIASNSLEYINDSAFLNCSNLQTIYLPNTLNKIGAKSFMNCISLHEINLNQKIQIIEESTFEYCVKLSNIFNSKLLEIKKRALYGCVNLKNVDNLIVDCISFGEESLGQCSVGSLTIYNLVQHISYVFSKTSFSHSKKLFFKSDTQYQYDYYIPKELHHLKIAKSQVSGDKLLGFKIDELTIDMSCDTIKSNAFLNSSFNKIIIENEHILLEVNALKGVKDGVLVFTNNNTKIIDSTYIMCQDTLIALTDSDLEEFTIDSQIKTVDPDCFSNATKLVSLIVKNGDNFSNISSLFSKSPVMIKKLKINISDIKDSYFSNLEHLEELIIEGDPKQVGYFAFENCKALKSLKLPESIFAIKDYAFSNCVSLNTIQFNDHVSEIGYSIFNGCSSLSHFSLPSSIKGKSSVLSLFGHESYENSYPITQKLDSDIERIYYVPYALKSIELSNGFITKGMFSNCSNIHISIKKYKGSIGAYGLYQCDTLQKFDFEKTTKSIGEYAFFGCKGLINISLTNQTVKIHPFAFASCLSLKQIYFGNLTEFIPNIINRCDQLEVIDFGKNSNFKSDSEFIVDLRTNQIVYYNRNSEKIEIVIPSYIREISEGLFQGNNIIKSVDLSASQIEHIRDYIFADCVNLKSFMSNNKLKSIGNYSFSGCLNLNHIILPETLEFIRSYAFRGCRSLRKIELPDELFYIYEYPFYKCNPHLIIYKNNLQNERFFDSRWKKHTKFMDLKVRDVSISEEDMRSKNSKANLVLSSIIATSLIMTMLIGVILAFRVMSSSSQISIPINEVESIITFFYVSDYQLNLALLITCLVFVFIGLTSFIASTFILYKERKTDFYSESKKTEILTNSLKELAILKDRQLITEAEYTRKKDVLISAGERK